MGSKLALWFGTSAMTGLMLTGAVGCVGGKEYNDVKAQRDTALIQRDRARVEVAGLKAESESYKSQVGALIGDTSKDSVITSLTTETAELRSRLAEINAKYADAMDSTSVSTGGSIPSDLNNKLASFAAQNKDVVEFDSGKGVVRFKSDATFTSGSSDLTPKGKAAAKKLADILSSKSGSGYELMVAGHTDATPISKSSTIKAGHKDNWHLSAHRAIAVGTVLQGNHVHPRRLAVVGYADQRPVASNATESGRSQNRRVEVVVTSSKLSAKDLAVTPKSSGKRTAKANSSPSGRDASADAGGSAFSK